MPRPRKAINYEEELAKVDAQIAQCDTTKAELNTRRQELLNAKREAEVGALYDILQKSGISVDDIMALISKPSQDQAG